MSYRDELEALAARHAALENEVAEKTRERDVSAQLLEEARAAARRPILDNIRVASPCPADWNEMTGDDRVRRCDSCKLDVYNLSGMTRAEAEELITSRIGPLCVRYYRRADGTILTTDCTVGERKRMRRRLAIAGAGVALASGAAVAAATAVEDVDALDHPREHTTTGMLVVLTPPPRDDHATVGKLRIIKDPDVVTLPTPRIPVDLTQPISPRAAARLRTSGETEIDPSEATRGAMVKRKLERVIGTWKLCLDDTGATTSIERLKSTGFDDYDHAIETAIHGWRHQPYIVEDRPVPVCSAVTFVYRL